MLDGIDLDVRTGETLVILGGSGSGKSTLLRCMVGLEEPDSGTVTIQGQDVFGISRRELLALRRKMGMAFQSGALFGSMTVAQNIELPLVELKKLFDQHGKNNEPIAGLSLPIRNDLRFVYKLSCPNLLLLKIQ